MGWLCPRSGRGEGPCRGWVALTSGIVAWLASCSGMPEARVHWSTTTLRAAGLGASMGADPGPMASMLSSFVRGPAARGPAADGPAATPPRAGCKPQLGCAPLPFEWRERAACCEPGTVPRPASGECTPSDDLSPNLDPHHGHYRAKTDADNWELPVDGSVLELLALYVFDNREGAAWPHGPHGNLYWDIFREDEPLDRSADGANRRRIVKPRVLRGPHRTHDLVDEWRDDEILTYRHAGLFRWGSIPRTEERIVLRIWESDLSEDGYLGRRDDVLGMELVDRAETETECGRWIPFHTYRNGHPRRRTKAIAAWALLRTWPAHDDGHAATEDRKLAASTAH